MANDRTEILFPEGRLIMGSLFKGSDKDDKGVARVVKNGPNAGKATTQYFIGVAYPKGAEQHWSQTAWGQKLLAVGHAAHPAMYQNPAFSWKIDDGDSTVPNKKNRRPCDSEGAKGHWVVKFSTNIPTKVYAKPNGALTQVTDENSVKTGYWVIVNASSTGNTGDSPGIYINHEMVLCTRADTVIENGPDAAAVFAGVAATQALPGVAALPFAGGAPALPAAMPAAMPSFGAPVPLAAFAAPPPLAVQPNPGFLAVPGAAAFPGVPGAPAAAMPMAPPVQMAPPPVPAEPAMTPLGASTGFTYAQYRANNWSDAQLRASGYIA